MSVEQAEVPAFIVETVERLEEFGSRELTPLDLPKVLPMLQALLAYGKWVVAHDMKASHLDYALRAAKARSALQVQLERVSGRPETQVHVPTHRTAMLIPVRILSLSAPGPDRVPQVECRAVGDGERISDHSVGMDSACDGGQLLMEAWEAPGAIFLLHVKVPRDGS